MTSAVDRAPALVEAAWLAAHLARADVKVLDATFILPGIGRDARAEFAERHIPGAQFFDIDTIADPNASVPHMAPGPEDFAAAVGRLGINTGDHVICYDSHGLMSAARPWWMFRLYGHHQVSVLDGGLPAWIDHGGALAAGTSTVAPGTFIAGFDPSLVVALDQVAVALDDGTTTVLDARAQARFEGTEPEPRAGVRAGHMPGAHNLPYTQLLDPATNRMLKPKALASLLADAHAENGPVITSCGSGVTACVLALGLAQIGRWDVRVYDGSWSEWGASDRPIVTGTG
jgi:thiosulfate/3-mercaptopyruvate sulfurtransferase